MTFLETRKHPNMFCAFARVLLDSDSHSKTNAQLTPNDCLTYLQQYQIMSFGSVKRLLVTDFFPSPCMSESECINIQMLFNW